MVYCMVAIIPADLIVLGINAVDRASEIILGVGLVDKIMLGPVAQHHHHPGKYKGNDKDP